MEYIATPYIDPEEIRKGTKTHHDANNKTRQKFNNI